MPKTNLISHPPVDMEAPSNRQAERALNNPSHPRRVGNVPTGNRSIVSGGRKSCPALYSIADDAPVDFCQSPDRTAASPSPININDFKRQYRQDSMNALFACAGNRRETLAQMLQNTPNRLAQRHLEHIANAHFLAGQLEPSAEQRASLDKVMHDLTDMMLKDKLGENSVFGGYRPEQKEVCVRRRGLEQKLALLLNTIQGEGGAKAGERFINEKIKPFVVDYIVQETGRGHDAVNRNHIEQLVEKNAYQCFQNIRSGIQTYQASSLEKTFRDMDMVLILPNLLADLHQAKNPPLTARLTSDAEQQTFAAGNNDRHDRKATAAEIEPPKANSAPGSYHFTYAPVNKTVFAPVINLLPSTATGSIHTQESDNNPDRRGSLVHRPVVGKKVADSQTSATTLRNDVKATQTDPGPGLDQAIATPTPALKQLISRLISASPPAQLTHFERVSPGIGQKIYNRPAEFDLNARNLANVPTKEGAKLGIPTNKSNSLLAATKEVAEAMEALIKAIPVSAHAALREASAPGNARPAEGAIPGVATTTKTRVPQTETTKAMLSAKGAPQSPALS
ncbi:hypothetical protein, partial [Acerihabitans arboris]